MLREEIKPSRSLKSLVKAVILDYGGVISQQPATEDVSALATALHTSPETLRALYGADRLLYDRGTITAEAYWRRFSEKTGAGLDGKAVDEIRRLDVQMWRDVKPQMIGWMERLRGGGFKTALLSNMPPDMAAYARQNFKWLDRLTSQVFSFEIGLVKPDEGQPRAADVDDG